MSMVVEPDRQPEKARSTGPGKRPAVIGAMALALTAVFVLSRFAAPAPTAEQETTTTTTAPQSTTTTGFQVRGEPFEWTRLAHFGNLPIAVLDVDGVTFVYRRHGPGAVGAELWSSDEGHRGLLVIDADHYVERVLDTWFGMMAVGTEVETRAPVVWTSTDGISWDLSPLPIDGIEGMGIVFDGAQASDELIVISGDASKPGDFSILHAQAETALREAFGELLEAFYWSDSGSGPEFVVYGPLWILLGSLSPEDLGLDPDQYRFDPDGQSDAVWASVDGSTWTLSTKDGPTYLHQMFTGPDGGIWALDDSTGFGGFLATRNGVDWRRVPTTHQVFDAVRWGPSVVGLNDSLGLVVGEDATNWRQLETPDLLEPGRVRPWSVAQFAADSTGLAIIASRSSGGHVSAQPQPEVIIKRDGPVELWFHHGSLAVRRLGEVMTVFEFSDPRQRHSIDPEEGTITFNDPTTGEALITVTADELRVAELGPETEGPGTSPGNIERLIMFTRDGLEWVVQGIGMFDDRQIYRMQVFEDRLVLVTGEGLGYSVMETPLP